MKRLTILIILCNLTLCAFARTIYVDANGTGDYPTIQAAIDDGNDGDIIIVHPGRYLERIQFIGNNIVLRSIGPEDPCIVSQTIIDANYSSNVVLFNGNESEDCMLTGFTITNGYVGGGFGARAAGIYGNSTLATITNCNITNNTLESTQCTGAGVYRCNGLIENCKITNNVIVSGGTAGYGGGLYECDGTIRKCIISNNVARGGGGLFGCDGNVIDCKISGNEAMYSGGGASECKANFIKCMFTNNICTDGRGGGYHGGTYGYAPQLIECKFMNNSAANGGGISHSLGLIDRCLISNNTAFKITTNNQSGRGAALYQCSRLISNSFIAHNLSYSSGSVLHNSHFGKLTMKNCTLYGHAQRVFYMWYSDIEIMNSIVWDYPDLGISESQFSYSCIENWAGGGVENFSSNPLLQADGCHLQAGSPCIDSGDPNSTAYLDMLDIDGRRRVYNGRVDVGAHEFNPNIIPVAIAGPNQFTYALIGGFAEVTLDGSASYDDDNDVLSYYWSWSIDSNNYEANGVSPTIELPLGEHIIELVVDDGIDYSQPDHVTIRVLPNAIPVAIAGPNQTAYICYGDVAEVMLDGSASYDDDNDVLSYYWSWIIDSNVYEANGVSPTIELPVGEQEIELIVDDGMDYSEPDYVTINVLPPVECQLLLKKDTLRLGQGGRWLQTTLIFSQSIGEEDIDLTAAITIEPIGLEASTVRVQDLPNRPLSLRAVFDVEALLQGLTPADIEVSVVGKLKDARCFSGIGIIQILPPK